MSKTTLKKEIAAMDACQLREMILDVYDTSKEAKNYFDFFLNPDVDKLSERRLAAFNKELNRSKHRRSKARVSVLKKIVADFAGYRPGAEHVRDFMVSCLHSMMLCDKHLDYTDIQNRYVARLISDIIKLSDAYGILEPSLQMIEGLVAGGDGRISFRRMMADSLKRAIEAGDAE